MHCYSCSAQLEIMLWRVFVILEWWIMLHCLAVWHMSLDLAEIWTMWLVSKCNTNCEVWWMRNNGLGFFLQSASLAPRFCDTFNFRAAVWRRAKQCPQRNSLLSAKWKRLIGPHRAVTTTITLTLGRNYITVCQPDLIARALCLYASMFYQNLLFWKLYLVIIVTSIAICFFFILK